MQNSVTAFPLFLPNENAIVWNHAMAIHPPDYISAEVMVTSQPCASMLV